MREYIDQTLRYKFISEGVKVNRGEWQSLTDDRPQMEVFEVYDVAIDSGVPQHREDWIDACEPNLPWAEDHFQERVGGIALNPGEQYKNWPWYEQGVEEHKPDGKFSHTYMERMWPPAIGGIRYEYGDLSDLVKLLLERPMTRQAYLPIWFPEDGMASAHLGVRVPCSLGYHFLMRSDGLDCTYYLRSCDFYRYLWDDIYMAGRLLQWVSQRINAVPGILHTKIANLHVFGPEEDRIRHEYTEHAQSKLFGAF